MKKLILIIAILFAGMSYGQSYKMDQFMYGYKAKHFKVTIKTMLNRNFTDGLASGDVGESDVVNVGAYDVRFKTYLTKRVSIVNRVIVTGMNTQTYFYSSGIIIKF